MSYNITNVLLFSRNILTFDHGCTCISAKIVFLSYFRISCLEWLRKQQAYQTQSPQRATCSHFSRQKGCTRFSQKIIWNKLLPNNFQTSELRNGVVTFKIAKQLSYKYKCSILQNLRYFMHQCGTVNVLTAGRVFDMPVLQHSH